MPGLRCFLFAVKSMILGIKVFLALFNEPSMRPSPHHGWLKSLQQDRFELDVEGPSHLLGNHILITTLSMDHRHERGGSRKSRVWYFSSWAIDYFSCSAGAGTLASLLVLTNICLCTAPSFTPEMHSLLLLPLRNPGFLQNLLQPPSLHEIFHDPLSPR